MLNNLVSFAIRFPGVVIALACVVIGYGLRLLALDDRLRDFRGQRRQPQHAARGRTRAHCS